ncbi:MAG: hypothetical protein J6X50_05305 [Bacilli bacterium]|nr:hypothetical protein [Bacilli bacterium]
MKKKKLLLIPVILSSLMCLTACNEVQQFFSELFDENAFSYSNKYNPPVSTGEETIEPGAIIAGGVVAKDAEETPNAYCFKNISYAKDDKILNTYKTGGVNQNEFNVNDNQDYPGSKFDNNFDLYVPKDLAKNQKHAVILFIHGGAWISGFKTDVNSYVHAFANKGYITATIKYSLLKKSMDDRSLSIFRNLDEIDACIDSIKSALEDLEFDTTKTELVIGGASSGAHLAMLYSYSRGQRSPLPINFVVDAVGPVNIKPEEWKRFDNMSLEEYDTALNNGLGYAAIEAERAADHLYALRVSDGSSESYDWNEYQTMRIANGMCGIPYSVADIESSTDSNKEEIINPNAASNAMTKSGGGEDQLSVTYWMNNTTNRFPIVTAYAGKDGVVGVAQYAALQNALDTLSIAYEHYYFRDCDHTNISKDTASYSGFVNKIDEWCQNALA